VALLRPGADRAAAVPTAEEREEYRRRNQPKAPGVSEAPPGYRFMVYTDPNGVPRRALIPIDPAAPGDALAASDAAAASNAVPGPDAAAVGDVPAATDAGDGRAPG
jgi:hypothetical protein